LIEATEPITEAISIGGTLVKTAVALFIVALVLAFVFFISGLFFKTYLGNSLRNWLEKKILVHVPFYETIKNITTQITGIEKGKYAVVEVCLENQNSSVLGILTETLSDGRHFVYCPFSPLLNIGQMYLVTDDCVKITDISLKDFSDIIGKAGFESDKLYKKIH
jgi:uncharacterized membrane protein